MVTAAALLVVMLCASVMLLIKVLERKPRRYSVDTLEVLHAGDTTTITQVRFAPRSRWWAEV